MERDGVVIRGTRRGLLILLNDELPWDELLVQLGERLAGSGTFFRGAVVSVDAGRRALSPAERERLAALLANPHGMVLAETIQSPYNPAQAAPAAAEAGRLSEATLVVQRTLRSGQAIYHHGDVFVLGDVNAGAEVVATGHIIVMGALRGVAHAGAAGDKDAVVAAGRLCPTQLRIAEHVSRPPAGDSPAVPEVARVHQGAIVIESGLERTAPTA